MDWEEVEAAPLPSAVSEMILLFMILPGMRGGDEVAILLRELPVFAVHSRLRRFHDKSVVTPY